MPRPKQNYGEILHAAEVMIDNARNDEGIAAALAVYGYSAEKLAEGRALLDSTLDLFNRQKKEFGDQVGATEDLHHIWTEADVAYMKAIKVARVAFASNSNARVALNLDGDRKTSVSGWIEQANKFYANLSADPTFSAAMASFGYTADRIASERELVRKVNDASIKQNKERGEAQEITRVRDMALDALSIWTSSLRKIARVALYDHPQWMEKLGVTVYSSDYVSTKITPAPSPAPAPTPAQQPAK